MCVRANGTLRLRDRSSRKQDVMIADVRSRKRNVTIAGQEFTQTERCDRVRAHAKDA